MIKYIFSPDKHVGFEKKQGKLVPLHDQKAIDSMLSFAQHFKPDIWIEGGDNLDCGPVSHWLKHKKASIADLDLKKDTQVYTKNVLNPINSIMGGKKKFWMIGNHECWLDDAIEENPGLQGVLDVRNLLNLSGWNLIEQGNHVKIGKLAFLHGDTIPNSKNMASVAIDRNNCSIAFGHFHTFQTFTKHCMLDAKEVMTGIAVPGLCHLNPKYLENRPNQWLNGFAFGFVDEKTGQFTNYVPIIINGSFFADGKRFSG